MRALLVSRGYPSRVGGIPAYVESLAAELARICDVGLLTEVAVSLPGHPGIPQFNVPGLAGRTTSEQWSETCAGVSAAIAAFAPDVVHFVDAGKAVYRDLIPSGVGSLATVHGNDLTAAWQRTPGGNATERIVRGLNRCDCVFAVSAHTAGLLAAWGVERPVRVVSAGCDLEAFRPRPEETFATRRRYGLPTDIPLVLTVGRLVARKGHASVLSALREIAIPVHWMVVGEGPTGGQLAASVDRFGMADRVSIVGPVPLEELALLYSACDVFVLVPEVRASGRWVDSEGFGLVFLEAAASGKPVIGSAVAGCREAVIDGGTGLLVAAGDPVAVRRAIERLCGDPGLAASLGAAGRAFLASAGGWPRLARQTLDAYTEVLAGNGQAVTAEPPAVVAPG